MNWMYLSYRGGSRKRLLTKPRPRLEGLDIAAIRLIDPGKDVPRSPDTPFKFESFSPLASPLLSPQTCFVKELPDNWDWNSVEWSSQVSRDSWGCPDELLGDQWL
jgi:hypothetical protein